MSPKKDIFMLLCFHNKLFSKLNVSKVKCFCSKGLHSDGKVRRGVDGKRCLQAKGKKQSGNFGTKTKHYIWQQARY